MSKLPVPFLGDIGEFAKRAQETPNRPVIMKYFREFFNEKIPSVFGMFWPHGLELMICDPDYVQDLYVTHNGAFTKHEYTKNLFSELTWNSLIWTKSAEPTYKPRRKLIAHAFYASKLRAMNDTMKKTILNRILAWPQLYKNGEVDLVSELANI